MRKVVSFIMICTLIMLLSTVAFASNTPELINGTEYENAQNNNTLNNTVNNTANNAVNNTTLPQTGIEDYNVVALAVVFGISAVFAYKKISDYREV